MKRPHQFARVLASLLGVFLAFFMTMEAAHMHAGHVGDGPAPAHCQLCATAHTAVASQPAWLTGFVLHLIGQVSIGEPSPGSRVVVVTAFIRPPPVEAAAA